MTERRPRGWSGQLTPLQRLGTYSSLRGPHGIGGGNLVGAPRDLLLAASDYCQSRVSDFAGRKDNHHRRNAIKFYSKWLRWIREELGEVTS